MAQDLTVGIAGLGAIGLHLARALDRGVPGLKLAHSFADDAFAIIAAGLGIALADSTVVAAFVGIYLLVGLVFRCYLPVHVLQC